MQKSELQKQVEETLRSLPSHLTCFQCQCSLSHNAAFVIQGVFMFRMRDWALNLKKLLTQISDHITQCEELPSHLNGMQNLQEGEQN